MPRKSEYNEDNIKVLKGLEAVRVKPSMYIGPPDSHGIFTILREVMDNSVDEYNANPKYDQMYVELHTDGTCVVHDNGQGIPVGKHKTEKVSTLQVAVGMLHAGGKLHGDGVYKISRGTHGIGVSATNALSEWFTVLTHRTKKWHGMEFAKGKVTANITVYDKKAVSDVVEPVFDQGTIILFKPDLSIFDKGSKLDRKAVHEWADLTAYLSAGFSVTIWDEKTEEETEYYHENGIRDWIDSSLSKFRKKINVLSKKPIELITDNVELCFTFTDSDKAQVYGYCNGLYQSEGGSHINTTLTLLYNSLEPYFKAREEFTKQDMLEGLLGIINFKIDSPRFSSQTKEKLVDSRFKEICQDDVYETFENYWLKNKSVARQVCERANNVYNARAAFRVSKEAARALKSVRDGTNKLPLKLAAVKDCPANERELFLIEGDSAEGTARAARITEPYRFQETLGLRGVVPNAYKMNWDKLMGNKEIISILAAIGYDPSLKNPLSNLRVGKIILLSDPDPDGYHINALLLSLISALLPNLLLKGLIYTVVSPKYVLNDNGIQYFGMSVEEIQEQIPKKTDINKVSYLKGWGEASAAAMRPIAFDPSTRQLISITKPTDRQFISLKELMGDDSQARKELLGI